MDAVTEFNRLSVSLAKMPQGKIGQSIENSYGAAYQQLVQAGRRPALKAKYRGPKAMARGGA